MATNRNRNRKHARHGSLVIEAAVALVLLSTAFVAFGKLVSSSAALSLNADQRLSATLTCENVLQQLRALSVESLADGASDVGAAAQESTGFDVQVESKPFQVNQREAVHVSVTVKASEAVVVTLHDWRISEDDTQTEIEGDDA